MIVNVALPAIAHGLHIGAVRFDLGRQRLSDRHSDRAAAIGVVGRDHRIPAGLSGRPGAVHPVLAAVRLRAILRVLVAARILQGLGAAGIMSVSPALLREFIYPRAALGRGIGFNVLVVSASACAGPPLAAAILSNAHWPLLFAVNIPLGLAALSAGYGSLPDTGRALRAFDWPGAMLAAMAIGSAFLAVAGLAHQASPWLIWPVLSFFTAIVSAMLWLRERRRAHPMVPVDLLRLPAFSFSVCASLSAFAAQGLILVALPFRLHHVFGYPVARIGLHH